MKIGLFCLIFICSYFRTRLFFFHHTVTSSAELEALREQLRQSEGLMQDMTMTWEEKLKVWGRMLLLCYSWPYFPPVGKGGQKIGADFYANFQIIIIKTINSLCALYFLQLAEDSIRERHRNLESMGISIHGAGISVDQNKFYLVNLNEDPSMNELLVYNLKVNCRFLSRTCIIFAVYLLYFSPLEIVEFTS
jgi:hypothetical protein